MRKIERIVVWSGLAASLALGLGLRLPEREAIAQPSGQVMRVATVDVFTLLEGLIESDKYKPAREARDQEIKTQYETLQAELKSLETKFQLIPQGTPEWQQTAEQGRQKTMEIQQFSQQKGREQDAFVASQVKDAYAVVHKAVNDVAERLGYTHVVATRLDPAAMKAESLAPAMQEILARPLIRTTASDDITAQVRAELNLPEKAPDAEAANPANTGGQR